MSTTNKDIYPLWLFYSGEWWINKQLQNINQISRMSRKLRTNTQQPILAHAPLSWTTAECQLKVTLRHAFIPHTVANTFSRLKDCFFLMTFSNQSCPCGRHEGIWSSQLHGPDALPSQREPRYSLNRRLNGPQSQCGRSGVQKNVFPQQKPNRYTSAVQPTA